MTEKKKKTNGISRRDFLKDAGLLVGGTAIGSTVLLAACGGETTTETVTRTNTATVTSTVGGATQTITTTVGAGETATITQTETATLTESRFVCPSCGTEFTTLALLNEHFENTHPGEQLTQLNINGELHQLKVEPNWTLLRVLRNAIGLTGTKASCEKGECGVCTVIMDGIPVYSCLILAATCEGKNIETIESLLDPITHQLHPLQEAFKAEHGMQCGFCTPGYIMTAKALLDNNPSPTTDEIKEGLSGVLCRCGNYTPIINSVKAAI